MSRMIDEQPKDMWELDCRKRLIEGLKVAISCCREYQKIEPKGGWHKMEHLLIAHGVMGKKLFEAKPQTKTELIQRADRIQNSLGVDPNQPL